MDGARGNNPEEAVAILTEEAVEVQEPSLYKVLIHNDDYTPMDFVVEVLQKVFHRPKPIATEIMLDVHNKGFGICGIYPYDIAETKINAVTALAREHEYPLRCSMEKNR